MTGTLINLKLILGSQNVFFTNTTLFYCDVSWNYITIDHNIKGIFFGLQSVFCILKLYYHYYILRVDIIMLPHCYIWWNLLSVEYSAVINTNSMYNVLRKT